MFKLLGLFLCLTIPCISWAGHRTPSKYDPLTWDGDDYERIFRQNRKRISRWFQKQISLAREYPGAVAELKRLKELLDVDRQAYAKKYQMQFLEVGNIARLQKSILPRIYRREKARMTEFFSYAVPTTKALETIAKYGPILELGAGTGYWAMLLRQIGTDIIAVDNFSDSEPYKIMWTPVETSDETCIQKYSSRTLFISFPTKNTDFAFNALSTYSGKYFLYIGEEKGGTTANDRFFELLERDFVRVDIVPLPNWPDQEDRLTVYGRKTQMTQAELQLSLPAPRSYAEYLKERELASMSMRCVFCQQRVSDSIVGCPGCTLEKIYCSEECRKLDFDVHCFRHTQDQGEIFGLEQIKSDRDKWKLKARF